MDSKFIFDVRKNSTEISFIYRQTLEQYSAKKHLYKTDTKQLYRLEKFRDSYCPELFLDKFVEVSNEPEKNNIIHELKSCIKLV